MTNKVLEEIITFAIQKLQDSYSYCGVAAGDVFTMINSGDDTDVIITIKEVINKPNSMGE